MDRRIFLKGLAILSTTCWIPLQFLSDTVDNGTNSEFGDLEQKPIGNIADNFEIDYTTKTINLKDNHNDGICIDELYDFIQNEWNTEHGDIPITKIHNTYHFGDISLQSFHI